MPESACRLAPHRPIRPNVSHTLLLADDSVTIQRVIELTFADEDVQVVAVGDGDQAIARLDSAPPDIVLADIGMPGKNGYEVAQYMKRTPRLAHIPVVLLTGAFEPVDDAKAAAAGCDGVLAKPFEPQLVIGRVRELLARSTPTASTPPAAAARPPAAVPPAKAPVLDDVERYFDRLDAAFAMLNKEPQKIDTPTPPPPDEHESMRQAEADAIADLPLSYASPQQAFEQPAAPEPEPAPAPVAAAPPPPVPSEKIAIADAFAALLAAEQREPAPVATGPRWPPMAVSSIVTDDLINRVACRVLEQLSDRVVRETVSQLVSTVAERLVREEIERLKSSIK
jgi:CheY-like chemotaxis protein